MTAPALATLTRHRSDLVPILAILSLAFGISAALRLDAPDRTSLMLAGAGCVAVGVTAAQFQSPSKRAVGAGSLAAGAGVALGQQTLDIESTALASLAWILAIAGTACWAQNSVLLARFVLLPAAAVAFAFPLLAHGVGTRSPATGHRATRGPSPHARHSGTAVIRLQIVTPKSVHLPSAALWGVAGATAIAAAISTEYTWTALTLFTIAAAMLADALLLAGDRQEDAHLAPDRRVVPTTLATAACAGALAIASLAAGKPYGWPVAGAAIAGLELPRCDRLEFRRSYRSDPRAPAPFGQGEPH